MINLEFEQESIIEDIYCSGIISRMRNSKKYQKLLNEYNNFYDTIADTELKEQFKKLTEIKNSLDSECNIQNFKAGFSLATKILVEAISYEPIKKECNKKEMEL